MKKTNRLITILIFIFLYIPMIVLIAASFNTGRDITEFEGFTFQQYVRLFKDSSLLSLLGNSILVAILSTAISTVFGTIAAVGIYRLKPKMRSVVMNLTNIPMTNPDIVTGVSLSLLFVFVGTKMLGHRDSLTFWTLLIAHITFSLPYVILNVMPKLHQMDSSLTDAAMDLGCTPLQAFFKVTLQEIMPGVATGAIMAFTMSLDDFVISYFVSGPSFITLPVEIYSYTKKPIQPKVYAMFTLLFVLIFVLMVAMNLLQFSSDRKRSKQQTTTPSRGAQITKRVVAIVAALAIVVGCGFFMFRGRGGQVTINVYNWGQYISDGTDDTLDVIAAFEAAHPNIKVNYSTYDSNEIMYSKLKNGGITVDVIIPSDYMIARLISEDMLLELDYSNIPNIEHIDSDIMEKASNAYDPGNKYSVPYTWGTVGILYNSKFVDESDVTGWELLWNEKYSGKILMFGNSRDAFGIAQYKLRSENNNQGYDVNSTDEAELRRCAEELTAQKPLLQNYVMDEIFATMENEEAWIAPYYAGDCLTMMDNNPDLQFYLPENQGFNLFIDAMCIPSCAQEKAAAETFINFLCEPEVAGPNMEWIGYGTPLKKDVVEAYMDPEILYSPVSNPTNLTNATSFAYLPDDTTRLMEELFMKVRNG